MQRDCSPYSLSYLSPPPDSSWRRSVHCSHCWVDAWDCSSELTVPFIRAVIVWRMQRKDYQNCSVLYCGLHLCTVISTLIWTVIAAELQTVALGLDVYVCVFLKLCQLCLVSGIISGLLWASLSAVVVQSVAVRKDSAVNWLLWSRECNTPSCIVRTGGLDFCCNVKFCRPVYDIYPDFSLVFRLHNNCGVWTKTAADHDKHCCCVSAQS